MLFSGADHARGAVEDGDKVGVQAGAAAYGAAGDEVDECGLCSRGGIAERWWEAGGALAEALCV